MPIIHYFTLWGWELTVWTARRLVWPEERRSEQGSERSQPSDPAGFARHRHSPAEHHPSERVQGRRPPGCLAGEEGRSQHLGSRLPPLVPPRSARHLGWPSGGADPAGFGTGTIIRRKKKSYSSIREDEAVRISGIRKDQAFWRPIADDFQSPEPDQKGWWVCLELPQWERFINPPPPSCPIHFYFSLLEAQILLGFLL